MDSLLLTIELFLTRLLWPLVQFLIGLGIVVFVHELGHYLAARWAGIRVDRFALGFGPRLVGIKRGETDYCLCAVPLGGYVKMLGQDDFKPAEDEQTVDPRSYQACPPGKRLVVIAAGVVMNVILAAVLFIVVSMVGMEFNAPVVGGTLPGYPAAETEITWLKPADADGPAPTTRPAPSEGLQGGDTLLSVNGEPISRLADLQMASALARTEPPEVFRVRLKRDIDGQAWIGQTDLAVKFNERLGAPQFGIQPAQTLTVRFPEDQRVDSPLQSGDRIVSVAGEVLRGSWQLNDVNERPTDQPVDVTVDRQGQRVTFRRRPRLDMSPEVSYLADGRRLEGLFLAEPTAGEEDVEFTDAEGNTLQVPPGKTALRTSDGGILVVDREEYVGGAEFSQLDVLGLAPRLKIHAVNELMGRFWQSPAAKAGLRPGDIVLSFADRPTPTNRQFIRIAQEIGENETTLTVLRDGQPIRLTVQPEMTDRGAKVGVINTVDSEHLAVAYVRPNSPADRAGIPAGAVLTAVNAQPVEDWSELVSALNGLVGEEVTLTATVGNETKTYPLATLTEDLYDPDDFSRVLFRSSPFEPIMVLIRHRNPLQAVAWGAEETVRIVVSTYQSLVAMIRGSVDAAKQARGPLGIGELAVGAARTGLLHLVYLMAFLSTALAVFNFLPIPVLDGGHAVLIIIEKVRGKPLPVKLVNVVQMVFLVLILGLFVVITLNDIARWF
jgi:regulator of sigma E protease